VSMEEKVEPGSRVPGVTPVALGLGRPDHDGASVSEQCGKADIPDGGSRKEAVPPVLDALYCCSPNWKVDRGRADLRDVVNGDAFLLGCEVGIPDGVRPVSEESGSRQFIGVCGEGDAHLTALATSIRSFQDRSPGSNAACDEPEGFVDGCRLQPEARFQFSSTSVRPREHPADHWAFAH
jgi:hypothetical protein